MNTFIWGDNCLPSFQVNDMSKFTKVKGLKCRDSFSSHKIKELWVLEFQDNKGNDWSYCIVIVKF